MTYEEAIEILQEERDYSQFPEYVKEAIKIAISAIEKQIPKKPNYEYEQTGIGISSVIRFPICPSCNSIDDGEQYAAGINEKFCCNCGQALDWSNTE